MTEIGAATCGALALVIDVDDYLVQSARRGGGWARSVLEQVEGIVTELFGDDTIDSDPPDSWVVTLVGPSRETADRATTAARALRALALDRVPAATVTVAIGEWSEGEDCRTAAAASAREMQAIKILTGGDSVLTHPAPASMVGGGGSADIRLERLLRDCAASRDPRAAGRVVESWLASVAGRAGASVDEVKSRLIVSVAAVAASTGGRVRADGTADVAGALVRMRPARVAELLRAHERSYLQLWVERAISDLLDDERTVVPSLTAQAERYIADNYRESELTLTSVARALAVSPTHLSHLFRAERDTTFLTHLTSVRIRAARALLAESSLPVAEIATHVGYSSTKQLWIRFRAAVGCSPLQFRALARASSGQSGLRGREQADVVDESSEARHRGVHAVSVLQG